ncbi:MAG TPA: methyltransferase domain-containing protein [Longimicrobiaceae bacterium]|nr:methyltransferase domain-containing protein [Longimicrobiaceae bacterium]
MTTTAGDYVLGTHDAEIARLGLQHRVWREPMLAAWRRAGLNEGWRVLDVGAGPGYVTLDLAEAVGPGGRVVAVERSPRFAGRVRHECERRGVENVRVVEADLMEPGDVEEVPRAGFDMAWCRWVASFVESPRALARLLGRAVRPGGRVVLHEYADYGTWRFVPPRPGLDRFVAEVMESWRAGGGEPNVAPPFVESLRAEGFRTLSLRPLIFTAAPGEPLWRWPASFVATNLSRLQELGRVSAGWSEQVLEELAEVEADPGARVITPLVLEVIAQRS